MAIPRAPDGRRWLGRVGALAALGVALVLPSAGCFDPQFPDGKVGCKVTSDCPPDLICSAGFCFHVQVDGDIVAAGGSGGASGHDGGAGGGGASAGRGGGSGGGAGHGGSGGGGGGAGREGADGSVGDGGCVANLCTVGDRRCGTNGLDTCVAVGNCTTWSSDVACTGRKTCQGTAPSAACQCPAAPTGCTGAGNTCVGGALVTCAVDGDSCIYSSSSTTCPTTEPCGGTFPSAVCTCPGKPSACTTGQPGTFCDSTGKAIVTCSLDGNKCLVATQPVSCAQPCTGAAGSVTCGTCPTPPTECSSAGTLCDVSGKLETCGSDPNTGCLSKTDDQPCRAPQTCQGSLPSAACVCPAAPAICAGQTGTVCASAGSTMVVTCAKVNGCLTATPLQTCPSPQTCAGSLPSAGCSCPSVAACQSGSSGSYCDTTNGNLVTCAQDGNGCFSASTGPCPTGMVCSGSFPNGTCVCPSVPNCPTAGTSCSNGSTLVTCTSAMGCLHEADTNCAASGLICSVSGGVAGCNCPPPTNGCGSATGKSCIADATLLTCSSVQGCIQGATTTCSTGQYCWNTTTACAPPTSVGYYADLGAVSNKTAGVLVGESVTVGAPFTLRSLGLVAGPAGGSLVSIGLYSDVGNAPSQLLASAQNKAVLPGRNEYAVTPVQLGMGNYWIMAVYDTVTPLEAAMAGGTTVTRQSLTTGWGSPLPTTLTGTTPQTGAATNYYILITQ